MCVALCAQVGGDVLFLLAGSLSVGAGGGGRRNGRAEVVMRWPAMNVTCRCLISTVGALESVRYHPLAFTGLLPPTVFIVTAFSYTNRRAHDVSGCGQSGPDGRPRCNGLWLGRLASVDAAVTSVRA